MIRITPLPQLTVPERKIIEILRNCQGHSRAVTRVQLVAATGLADRNVREIIQGLIETYSYPICSSPSISGYYIAGKAADLDKAINTIHGQGISLLVREKALKKALKNYFPRSQGQQNLLEGATP